MTQEHNYKKIRDKISIEGKLGHYELKEQLFVDMSGAFYHAHDLSKSEDISILILPSLKSFNDISPNELESLENKLKEIESPHILKFRKIEHCNDLILLVFDGFKGTTLKQYILNFIQKNLENTIGGMEDASKKRPNQIPQDVRLQSSTPFAKHTFLPLPSEEAKAFLHQTTEALATANKSGLLHLNLLPEHLLITKEGQIQVVGFGISQLFEFSVYERIVSALVPPIEENQIHINLKSLDLRSPEMQRGKAPDTPCEIYGLGVLGYYLLTGNTPKNDGKFTEEESEDIGLGWKVLIEGCLEEDRQKRYHSLETIKKDLARIEELKERENEEKYTPKSDQELLKQKKHIHLLLLILFGVLVIIAGKYSFNILTQDEDKGPATLLVKKAINEENANIIIHTIPQQAVVRLSGTAEGKFPLQNGEALLRGPEGIYELHVEAPFHKAYSGKIDNINEVAIQQISLTPNWAPLDIQTTPNTRISVKISEKGLRYLGQTDAEGKLHIQEKLFSGSYTIMANHPAYLPAEKAVELQEGENELLQFDLIPSGISITILSNPEDATVYLGEKKLGNTPLVLTNVKPETTIQYKVQRKGYRDAIQEVTPNIGENIILDFGNLEQKLGDVNLQVKSTGLEPSKKVLSELKVQIGDDIYPYQSHYTNIPENTYKIKAIHPDYSSNESDIEVWDQKETNAEIIVSPLPAFIGITTEPRVPFEVILNGDIRKPNEKGYYQLTPGLEYEMEIHAKDYLVIKRKLKFDANEIKIWPVKLQRIPAPVQLGNWVVPYLGIAMSAIAPGNFYMGSPKEEPGRLPNEGPQTRVELTYPFWMSLYEITQHEYRALMPDNRSNFVSLNNPVENVNWYEAVKFCEKLTAREREAKRLPEGYVYRLPTQAEWEYVCRAGSQTPFEFGDTASPENGNFVGTYPKSYNEKDEDIFEKTEEKSTKISYGTRPVGSYAPNAWGVYDMHGNVAEWCIDPFNDRYPGLKVTDWAGAPEGSDRPIRGGGWSDSAQRCRSASRDRMSRKIRSNSVGFRIVLAPELPEG